MVTDKRGKKQQYRGKPYNAQTDKGKQKANCDTVGELTWVLRLFSHLFGLARVATNFFIYPKERAKSTGKTFDMFSWVRGVDYEMRSGDIIDLI